MWSLGKKYPVTSVSTVVTRNTKVHVGSVFDPNMPKSATTPGEDADQAQDDVKLGEGGDRHSKDHDATPPAERLGGAQI